MSDYITNLADAVDQYRKETGKYPLDFKLEHWQSDFVRWLVLQIQQLEDAIYCYDQELAFTPNDVSKQVVEQAIQNSIKRQKE